MKHPDNKKYERSEKKGRDKTTKRVGPSVQVVLKNQMEVVEAENASLGPHIRILHYALTVECTSIKQKNDWNLQPFKLEVQDEAYPIKWSHMIYYFISSHF